jgi:hypothetical protein
MGRTTAMLMAGCLVAALGGEASAQTGADRDYYVSVSGGKQSGSSSFADERTFTVYDEPGTIIFSGNVGSPTIFDIAAGRRITGRWTGGLAFHKGSKSGSGILVVGVPHPLFFGRARDTSEAVGGLRREEQATHLQVGYRWDVADKVEVHIVGGPSFFRVKQTVVTDATFEEVGPPFTNITTAPVFGTRSKNAVGAHIGADASYWFYEQDRFILGAGLFLRYAGASANMQLLDNEVKSSPGGFQYALGLRVGF